MNEAKFKKDEYVSYESDIFRVIDVKTVDIDGVMVNTYDITDDANYTYYDVMEQDLKSVGSVFNSSVKQNNKKVYDNVNAPKHYVTGKYECIEVMEEVFGTEALKNFCLCNAFKYLYRSNRKNGVEDLKKAKWYIDRYIKLSEQQ